jgi:ribosomal protein S18 acetylase RimI-like enzyme
VTPICESWQVAPTTEVQGLLRRECTRWSVDLGWDLARDWAAVEPARRAGLLSGWVVRGTDRQARGWAFGVDLEGERQVGAVVADDEDAAHRLIEELTADTSIAHALAFVRVNDVVTADLLRTSGFGVQPYLYLVAPSGGATGVAEAWQTDDRVATAELLMRAYADDRTLRPFARRGTPDEWLEYVDALTMRPGCGVFSPQSSVVIRLGQRLLGVALVTSIGPTTAHLAQLAVAPEARGRGLASTLLTAARANAERVLRASRLSLLVSAANASAFGLYARAGFRHAGDFVAASLDLEHLEREGVSPRVARTHRRAHQSASDAVTPSGPSTRRRPRAVTTRDDTR